MRDVPASGKDEPFIRHERQVVATEEQRRESAAMIAISMNSANMNSPIFIALYSVK